MMNGKSRRRPSGTLPHNGRTLFNSVWKLNLQHLLKSGQVPRVVIRYQGDVLDPHSTQFRIIKARFHSDDLPCLKFSVRVFSHSWRLMYFQPETVPGSVEKALHS